MVIFKLNIHLSKLRFRVCGVGEQRLESAADLRQLSPEGGRLEAEQDGEAAEEAA